MYKFIKQKLIILVLVPVCFGKYLAIRSVSMNNRLCMVRQTLIDLNPDELYHYPFIISMNRCNGPCNTAEDPFGGICIPNKVFNMIIGINESKTKLPYLRADVNFIVGNVTQDKNGRMIRGKVENQ